MDTPLTIPALLARSAAQFGSHIYLATPADRLSYAQAEQRSGQLARRLLGAGIGKGSRVGLFFPNSTDWVLWWLAVSRIGAVAVPLSTLYRPAELAKVLRLADIAVLIAPPAVLGIDVADRLQTALPELCGQPAGHLSVVAAPYLRRVLITGACEHGWAEDPAAIDPVPGELFAAVEAEVTPADLAIMVHTSGSTADPKGVLHTHGTLVRQTSTWPAAARVVTGSGADARVLCAMPFFWIGGVLAAAGALHEPTTVLTLPRLEPAAALDLIESEQATGLIGWPAFTQRLREHPSFGARDLSSAPLLRDGPLDIAMVDVPDGFPVHRTMSETAGGFVHTELAIVDEHGQPVPEGTVGELWVRGIGVMAGYNKRERHETFDADGWYRSGDRVYRRAGDPRLFYVGRSTDLIKSAGANVSPLEVEAVIEGFEDVAQCVVFGVDDEERDQVVCAVVVGAGTGAPDLDSIAGRAREQLSSYKVPTRWSVADSAQVPILASGKLNRNALRDMVTGGELASVTIG